MISFFKFFFLWIIFTSNLFAQEIPPLEGPVVDIPQLLSKEATLSIERALHTFYENEGIQFQVLIINKLEHETIETYSIKVLDRWQLGKKGEDLAALLVISVLDKKMRIEVGRGLEGTLTDLITHRILDEIKPHFKNNKFDDGVALALELMAQTQNKTLTFDKNLTPRHARKKASSSLVLITLMGLIFFFQYFFPNGGGRGPRGGGRIFYGGGGGFSGGGSSWGGGGGGFSGGGASGDW